MIVVMGAAGRLGRAVVEELLARIPARRIGVSTRDPERSGELERRGVRVRRGDYDDPASLERAFEGADRVLLVSAPRHGAAAVEAHARAIAAARSAGVGRILYTSHVGADALSAFGPAVVHAATEVLLRDSGVPFTAVRNGFYADTPVRLLREAAESGELVVPADAPISWTVHADLAPGIAALLADDGLDLPAVNLTAGIAADMSALAATASAVLQRPIRRRVVADGEYVDRLVAGGVPQLGARMTLGIFRAARQGHLGIVDPALADLIGRPTTDVHALIRRELAA
jgi:NAD(P)H dehydrogenase (quinone)